MITDVCHPVHDWYILLSRIFISRIQPLPIPKNFPMVQEPQRKRKEPTLRRTKQGSLLWCLSLTRANLSFSGKCHSRGLIEPRNQRAAIIFRLCNAQRSSKNSKNGAQRFFNNENKPQSRPGKESCTQSIQEGIFLSSTRNFSTAFNFPSSFRTSSTTTAPPEGCIPPEHIFLLA